MGRFISGLILLTVIVSVFAFGCGKGRRESIPPSDVQYRKAMAEYERGDWTDAQIEFEKLIFNYPGETVVDTAIYYMAMSYYNDKEYALAAGEFERLITGYGTSNFADDAQYALAMCHYKRSPHYALDQRETNRAIDEFRDYIELYPTGSKVDSARAYRAELYEKLARKMHKNGVIYMKLRDYESALLYFETLLDRYSFTSYAQSAHYQIGECHMKRKEYQKASEAFQKAFTEYDGEEIAARARKKYETLLQKHPEINQADRSDAQS